MNHTINIPECHALQVGTHRWPNGFLHHRLQFHRYLRRKQLEQLRHTLRTFGHTFLPFGGVRGGDECHLAFILYRFQQLLQSVRHTLARFVQRIRDCLAPLILREPVIAWNHPLHHSLIIVADRSQRHRQLIRLHVPVTLCRFLPLVEELPVFGDDHRIRDVVIAQTNSIMKFCRTFSAHLLGGDSLHTGLTPCAVFCHPFRVLCDCFIDKQLIIKIEQILLARRCRKEHPRDVLRTLVELHTKQVACPTEVVLLTQLCLTLEHKVIAFTTCRQLQHQQSQFIFLREDALFHFLHLLLGDVINVHANGGGHLSTAFQRTILVRHTRIIHLQQTMLHLVVTLADTANDRLLFLCVAEISVLRCRENRAHHFRPILIVYYVTAHILTIL